MAVTRLTPVAAREQFMRRAMAMATRSLAAGGPPVGACLVRDGVEIAVAQNEVVSALDLTAHAEIQVIRAACTKLRALSLAGCELYVTVEPCAMCAAACFYAQIERIWFGAPIAAMTALTGSELSAAGLCGQQHPENPEGSQLPPIEGPLLGDECQALLDQWRKAPVA